MSDVPEMPDIADMNQMPNMPEMHEVPEMVGNEYEAELESRLLSLMGGMDRTGHFLGACEDYSIANAVILGIPMDFTVSFRAGSRLGPRRIREMSHVLEEYSWVRGESLDNRRYFDMGDLILPFGSVGSSLSTIREAAEVLLDDGKFICGLGGEHLVTWPLFSAVAQCVPELVLVQFDAHADLRQDYMGQKESHASVIRRIAEIVHPRRIYQFGIRSGSMEELAWGHQHTNLHMGEFRTALESCLEEIGSSPVYLTIDIDVVDPAYAPGTGTPEPGGCTSKDLIAALHLMSDCTVVGMDVVEVAPAYDHGDITSALAAKLVREALLQWT